MNLPFPVRSHVWNITDRDKLSLYKEKKMKVQKTTAHPGLSLQFKGSCPATAASSVASILSKPLTPAKRQLCQRGGEGGNINNPVVTTCTDGLSFVLPSCLPRIRSSSITRYNMKAAAGVCLSLKVAVMHLPLLLPYTPSSSFAH